MRRLAGPLLITMIVRGAHLPDAMTLTTIPKVEGLVLEAVLESDRRIIEVAGVSRYRILQSSVTLTVYQDRMKLAMVDLLVDHLRVDIMMPLLRLPQSLRIALNKLFACSR